MRPHRRRREHPLDVVLLPALPSASRAPCTAGTSSSTGSRSAPRTTLGGGRRAALRAARMPPRPRSSLRGARRHDPRGARLPPEAREASRGQLRAQLHGGQRPGVRQGRAATLVAARRGRRRALDRTAGVPPTIRSRFASVAAGIRAEARSSRRAAPLDPSQVPQAIPRQRTGPMQSNSQERADVVFTFSMEMFDNAVAREFCRPPDQTFVALARDDRVGQLLVADPWRSYALSTARRRPLRLVEPIALDGRLRCASDRIACADLITRRASSPARTQAYGHPRQGTGPRPRGVGGTGRGPPLS